MSCCPKVRCRTVSIKDRACDNEQQRSVCSNGRQTNVDGREAESFSCLAPPAPPSPCGKEGGWPSWFGRSTARKAPRLCAPDNSCNPCCEPAPHAASRATPATRGLPAGHPLLWPVRPVLRPAPV